MLSYLPVLAAEKPNSAVLPGDINEVYWGTFAFLVVAAALWKFGYGPARDALAKRKQQISDELDEAAASRQEASGQLETLRTQLSNKDAEHARILAESKQSAEALKVDMDARSDTEVVELRARAERDLEASRGQAFADLEHIAGDLTFGAAEVVVKNSLDEQAQQELIESYIAQVGSN